MSDLIPYSKEKLKNIEKIITYSVKKILKSKIKLSQSDWGVCYNIDDKNSKEHWFLVKNQCCLAGAVLLVKQPEAAVTFDHQVDARARATICSIFDVSYRFVSGMIQGYDNCNTYSDAKRVNLAYEKSIQYVQGFDLGFKLGNKFLPKKETNE